MARINLLPWRAERRARRQKEFYGLLGASALAAVLLGFLIVSYYNGQLEGQGQRNAFLQTEIQKLDAQIKEIEDLDRKKAQLLMRKQVIEELQASRSQMVHLFDELVRTIPDGVRLTSIKQAGEVLTLEGQSQSNARVSTYMRNIEASGWMREPDLSIIEAKGDDKSLPFMFSLRFRMSNPLATKPENDDDLAAGGVQ
jgi:type IV pilus assembly protein PilN